MSIALDLGKTVSDWFAKVQAPDDDFSQMPISYQDQRGAEAVQDVSVAVAMAPVHAVENALDSAKAAATDLTWQLAAWGGVAFVAYLGIQKLGGR